MQSSVIPPTKRGIPLPPPPPKKILNSEKIRFFYQDSTESDGGAAGSLRGGNRGLPLRYGKFQSITSASFKCTAHISVLWIRSDLALLDLEGIVLGMRPQTGSRSKEIFFIVKISIL
jgi:hypothetical protein